MSGTSVVLEDMLISRGRTGLMKKFSRLGIGGELQEKLKSHLARIQHARAEAENYLLQLDRAKNAYDRVVRREFSPEQYQTYRNAEAEKPVIRQFELMRSYFQTSGFEELTSEEEDYFLETLRKSHRVSAVDGPYGTGVQAMDGKEKVLNAMNEDLNVIEVERTEFLSNIGTGGELGDLVNKARLFYDEQIRRKKLEIQFMLNPEGEQRP